MDYLNKFNYPAIKTRITPLITKTKAEIRETTGFYVGNAKQGWELGKEIAQQQNRNPITSFLIKSGKAISKTRIRGKDITPIVTSTIFFINPIPGMGVIGFALGKAIHPAIKKGFNILKSMTTKLRIK